MLFSWPWIKKFLISPTDTYPSLSEIINKLKNRGFEINIEQVKNPLNLNRNISEKILICKIIQVQKHPNADLLFLCKVTLDEDIKEENLLQIVCGAENVQVGQKVPLATVGTEMPNQMKIKKTKIRGYVSEGMLCSYYEIFSEGDRDNIWILDKNAPLKASISSYIQKNPSFEENENVLLDINLASNRSDLHSVFGMAQEIQSLFSDDLSLNVNSEKSFHLKMDPNIKIPKIEIQDTQLCGRYTACVIENVTVKESPEWIKKDLNSINISSVNSIVDISNWLLFSFGQPTHAFDLDTIQGDIYIETLESETNFIALNEKKYSFASKVLCIKDKKEIIALAGLIGSKSTAITNSTQNILIESAYFQPEIIYDSIQNLKIAKIDRSTASQFFLRKTNIHYTKWIVLYFLKLVQDLNPESRFSFISDIYPNSQLHIENEIALDVEDLKHCVGIEIPNNEILHILKALSYKIKKQDTSTNIWTLQIPKHRLDIENEMDIYEDILRVYGYKEIPSIYKTTPINNLIHNPYPPFAFYIRERMQNLNFKEVYNPSFIEDAIYKSVDMSMRKIFNFQLENLKKEEFIIRIKNPLCNDQKYLRYSLIFSLLESLNSNIYKGQQNLELFELGNVYALENGQINEKKNLAGILYGKNKSLLILKDQIIEILESFIHPSNIHIHSHLDEKSLNSKGILYLYHPNQRAEMSINEKIIGSMGALNPILKNEFKWSSPVFFFEINLDVLSEFYSNKKMLRYEKISDYPPAFRELTIDIPIPIEFQDIEKLMYTSTALLKRVHFTDIYYHGNQKEKSFSFLLEFQSLSKTLTYEEVNTEFLNISKILKVQVNGNVRGIENINNEGSN